MIKFEKTLAVAMKQANAYQQQLALLEKFKEALIQINESGSVPAWIRFEVQFQCYWPGHVPIRVVDVSLGVAYEKAVVFWNQHNGKHNHPKVPRADAFVQINDALLVISATDAALIAGHDNGKQFSPEQFTLDGSLVQLVGKTIWETSEKLPGHRASALTVEPEEEVEVQPPNPT